MKEYLVIQLARFGDIIQTKRLVMTLCARPGARVHLCVDTSLVSLARLVYPQVTVHGITAHGTGLEKNEAIHAMLVGNANVFSALTAIDFSEIYNLNLSGLNFRMAALFPPPKIRGHAWHNGQEISDLWAAMAMRWSASRRIAINLVDFWAGYSKDAIAPEDVNPVATPKGNGIGVVLAGRESRRSLPVEILTQIITTMVRSSRASRVHLLGGSNERHIGQQILKGLPPDVQEKTNNTAGKTDWTDLVQLVGSLDMLVTPDTGTMHLAAHLGVPVKAFFLSSAWCFETGPYGRGHTVYQALTDCLPCLETRPCMYDMQCLGAFSKSAFQRFLVTGKAMHCPENIVAFTSEFDALGQTYTAFAGKDRDWEQRTQFRTFIQQYLTGKPQGVSEMDAVFAQRMYTEKDWTTRIEGSNDFGF